MTISDHPPPLDAESRAEEAPDDHKAELRLWLRLLTCATMIEREIRTRLRDRFDVTLPRFDLMAQLEQARPDGMTLGELSRRMMVSNGNITGLVERLAELGLIERLPHPADRRATFVRLSPAGRAQFAEMAQVHAEWVGTLFAGLPAEETAQLMRLLAGLKQSVQRDIEARKTARA